MGRAGRSKARGRALAQQSVRRTELKTLSGISNHLFHIENEDDMKNFRSFLFNQTDPSLRPALIQFRLYDLSDRERKEMTTRDIESLKNASVSDKLQKAAKQDPDISSYLAALVSLQGMSEDVDLKIEKILATLEQGIKKGPLSLDLAQIEILAAKVSPDRNSKKLESELAKAKDLFQKAGITLPSVEIILIPPVVSALASNCDQTKPAERGLRSGRYYQNDQVILIADDRSVIDKDLLIHEIIHALQNEQNKEKAQDLDPELKKIFEAFTEAAVLKINPQYNSYSSELVIIKRLRKLIPDDQEFEKVAFLPAKEMKRCLAEKIFAEKEYSSSDLSRELSKIAR